MSGSNALDLQIADPVGINQNCGSAGGLLNSNFEVISPGRLDMRNQAELDDSTDPIDGLACS